MSRETKVIEVMSLLTLSEKDRLAKLANQLVGEPVSAERARAVIKCYFDPSGRLPRLTEQLLQEKHRQEKLRNERKAIKLAAKAAAESPLERYRGPSGARAKKQRALEIAVKSFGAHVQENFNPDSLAMMSLISGEDRHYEVRWRDAGFSPVKSAVVEVRTISPTHGCFYNLFLLYQVGQRVLTARTGADDITGAWACQVPEGFLNEIPTLRQEGCSFKNDLEDQSLVVYGPDGKEIRRVMWQGRTVDE